MNDAPAQLEINHRRLRVSNLDKILYPSIGFTKAAMLDYYVRVAPAMLPHLRDRPVTLRRYPDGVDGETFFEKNCPGHRPTWVKTAEVWSGRKERNTRFCLINDIETLVWVANLAAIELHPSLSFATDLTRPTVLAFDLDPGAPADVIACAQVALMLKKMLESLGLASLPKTSGSKGLQVYVPLNTKASYEETKTFARAAAELLERQAPKLVTSNMRKDLRGGKVFVDWSQNDPHKTTVAVYSLRARERPTVSTPLIWAEVELAARKRRATLLEFEAADVLKRVAKYGDLFAPVFAVMQQLPTLR